MVEHQNISLTVPDSPIAELSSAIAVKVQAQRQNHILLLIGELNAAYSEKSGECQVLGGTTVAKIPE